MSATTNHRHLSLWWDTLPEEPPLCPPLSGDLDVDVAIVGGGFTGLWTARSLLERDPSLRIAILEAEVCGFGASGRNGGWASALFATSDSRLVKEHGHAQTSAMRAAMVESISEIQAASSDDRIDCDFTRGGTLIMARTEAQRARCLAEVAEAAELKIPGGELEWLEADAAKERIGASDVLGATFTPHCAAINPAKLVVGLSAHVIARGATIFEGTNVLEIIPGGPGRRPKARTARGVVTADVVVRATEAWTSQFEGAKRSILPVYSLMIATEPLSPEVLGSIGLRNRETFADHRHMVVYGQRTNDARIAFGGRGAPYHFGSTINGSFDRDDRVFSDLKRTLIEMFPVLSDTLITHSWGGPLGIARDWHSSVGLDPTTSIAWAGGYVGDGVTTTNLAGRTLADLILHRSTPLTTLPWVGHRSPRWEPEPLRWLEVNAGLFGTALSDRIENRTGKRSRFADLVTKVLGH